MRLLFMGTPEFAVPCLARLIADGHEITGVFTQPDKPKGRGHKLAPPPVKELALQHNLTVYQPEKLRVGNFPCFEAGFSCGSGLWAHFAKRTAGGTAFGLCQCPWLFAAEIPGSCPYPVERFKWRSRWRHYHYVYGGRAGQRRYDFAGKNTHWGK